MSLSTFSVFYYNYEFTTDTQDICFDEGSGELIAEVELGEYTATEMALAIQNALNATGTLTYIVTFNRSDRTFTIESTSGSFDLLVSSGTSSSSAYGVFGFTGADRTGGNDYTGSPAGSEYKPQFILQDHISTDDLQKLIKPSINQSATGRVEVVRFGVEKFLQCNIKYATNLSGHADFKNFRKNLTGVQDLRSFMQYITQKKPFEFMADELNRSTFQKFILESTEEESNGTGYRLKELYDKGLPNFFETGILRFRLID